MGVGIAAIVGCTERSLVEGTTSTTSTSPGEASDGAGTGGSAGPSAGPHSISSSGDETTTGGDGSSGATSADTDTTTGGAQPCGEVVLSNGIRFACLSLPDVSGYQLAAADFDGDGIDDLAVGAPDETLGPVGQAGLLHVLYGEAGGGLGNSRDQIWLQTLDPSEDADHFSAALAAGHFSRHTGADLAIGSPGETIGGLVATGAVNVLFSQALLVDGFESGDMSSWQPPV